MNVILSTETLRPELTGIGNYTLHLLRGLLARADVDEVLCFGERGWEDPATLAAPAPATGAVPGAAPTGLRRRLTDIARALPGAYRMRDGLRARRFRSGCRTAGPALYHEPNFILKPFDGPCVATIHDLSHLRHPRFHPRGRVAWLERSLPDTLRRADRLLTVSEFVRAELVTALGVDATRIDAIPLGVDPVFRPRVADETRQVLEGFGLSHGRYLLSVATFEPRKNLAGLLDAWQQLDPQLRRAYPLVLAGAPGWGPTTTPRMARQLAQADVKMLGYVPAHALPVLYSGAAAFAFVSFYEGFGLPVLEAMASGAAVLTSRRASMPEVLGEAGLLADPEDTGEIADALARLLDDAALRARLGAAARERARTFSWDAFVERTVSAYRRVWTQRQ